MALLDGAAILGFASTKLTYQSWKRISYRSHAPAWECSLGRSRAVPLERLRIALPRWSVGTIPKDAAGGASAREWGVMALIDGAATLRLLVCSVTD